MNARLIALIGCLVPLPVCGCLTLASEKAASAVAPAAIEKVSFDQSPPGAETGTLIVHFRQPTYQLSVDKYAVKIDSNPALVVSKQSDAAIRLAAGRHSLKFYAASSNPDECDKVAFGKPTTREVDILKDREQKVQYTGPYRLFGEGKFELVE